MRVTAINGSPRGAGSNTAIMIRALLDGFASNGDLVENVMLSGKHIEFCSGCYTCWSRTPGVCVHDDDMKEVIQRIRGAQVLIIGSPLYFNNVSGTLKVFFDRLTAAGGSPHEKNAAAASRAAPAYVMVSNCGFAVRDQFDIVSLWIHRVARMMKSAVIAEFYATSGKILASPTAEQSAARTRYLDYLRDCGKCLSQNMKLDNEHVALSALDILDFGKDASTG
jgi:multimeric flavodoxin WrbA